jgi:hypothetical protein
MTGILVHGDNHFILRGPTPSRLEALDLVRFWSLIRIGGTPPHRGSWTIRTRECRENLQWAVVVETGVPRTPAVGRLLAELAARGVEISVIDLR